MSLAAWSTPFFTTDQNGSDAWPWLTTSMLMFARSPLPPPPADGAGVLLDEQAATRSAAVATPMRTLVNFTSTPPPDVSRAPAGGGPPGRLLRVPARLG